MLGSWAAGCRRGVSDQWPSNALVTFCCVQQQHLWLTDGPKAARGPRFGWQTVLPGGWKLVLHVGMDFWLQQDVRCRWP